MQSHGHVLRAGFGFRLLPVVDGGVGESWTRSAGRMLAPRQGYGLGIDVFAPRLALCPEEQRHTKAVHQGAARAQRDQILFAVFVGCQVQETKARHLQCIGVRGQTRQMVFERFLMHGVQVLVQRLQQGQWMGKRMGGCWVHGGSAFILQEAQKN